MRSRCGRPASSRRPADESSRKPIGSRPGSHRDHHSRRPDSLASRPSGVRTGDRRPIVRIVGRLHAYPLIWLLEPGQNAVGEIVEDQVAAFSANHRDKVMLAPRRHDFAQQHRLSRPSPGNQLMTLGHSVVVAIAEGRAEQPSFASEARSFRSGTIDAFT